MTYHYFTDANQASAWLVSERDNGFSGYMMKLCDDVYEVRIW